MLTQVRKAGRPIRRGSSAVDRLMTDRETRRTLSENPIVIFSMGKTGTSSLFRALRLHSGRRILKAHALSSEGIARRAAKEANLGVLTRPRFWWRCETIADVLFEPSAGADRHVPWDLICGVRDPVALAVSDHFYNLQRQADAGVRPWLTGDNTVHARAIHDNLRRNFIDRDWFEDELNAVTGIDVYATPFPMSGVSDYSSGDFRALVIRNEDLADVGPRAVSEFLDLREPLPIERVNVGRRSAEADPYQRFLASGALDAEIIDEVYRNRLATHFYTTAERESLKRRWTNPESAR